MPTPSIVVRHDEPVDTDTLDRDKYAAAFAELSLTCETPMVIGLFGGWGTGKTTLMQLVRRHLADRAATVWFDSWLHQYDETPALALLQSAVQQHNMGEAGKKLVLTVAAAFGSALMQRFTGIGIEDMKAAMQQFEEERFQVREVRSRLRDYFAEVVARITDDRKKRLVIFIDDLDRCSAETTLAMLEALKLYLNLPNCVYFLGVDRSALERSITHRYGDRAVSDIHYLDKIVQLPFTIPPISPGSIDGFVSSLLSEPLADCKPILLAGLGDNPRRVKRFLNSLVLNHQLALQAALPNYDPRLLTLLLLAQHRDPEVYDRLVDDPQRFAEIYAGDGDAEARKALIGDDVRLARAFELLPHDAVRSIESYLYLTEIAGVSAIDEVEVILLETGETKIAVIKVIREFSGLPLKEAKAITDAPPQVVMRTTRDRARELVKQLAERGAHAEIGIVAPE